MLTWVSRLLHSRYLLKLFGVQFHYRRPYLCRDLLEIRWSHCTLNFDCFWQGFDCQSFILLVDQCTPATKVLYFMTYCNACLGEVDCESEKNDADQDHATLSCEVCTQSAVVVGKCDEAVEVEAHHGLIEEGHSVLVGVLKWSPVEYEHLHYTRLDHY